MAVEGINKKHTQNLASEETKFFSPLGNIVKNGAKDSVSIGGKNVVYDTQLNSLRSEIGELKQLVNTIVAQEFLANRGGTPLTRITGNPAISGTAVLGTSSAKDENKLQAPNAPPAPNIPQDSNKPQDPKPNVPEEPKKKTDDELIKEAMHQQILAQMKIKRDMLEWDTTLMKEKFEYELALSWQQHQTKISEMMMAAFSKIREMNEQMWLNLKQKEDQLDSQRIKILGGF